MIEVRNMVRLLTQLVGAMLYIGCAVLLGGRCRKVPTDDVFTILLLMVSQLVGYLSIGSWWVALLVFGNIYLALRVAQITDSRGFPSRTQLNSLMLALIPTLMLLGIFGRLSVYRGTFGAGLMALLVIAVYACAVVREINKGKKA